MSESWAIVKPCSASGRHAIGTSTRTIAAVRRALNSPSSEARSASNGTAAAVIPTLAAVAASSPGTSNPATHRSARSASRSSVRTMSEEKNPIETLPAQASRSASGWCRSRRASKVIGISTAETSSTTAKPTPADAGSAGATRTPT